MSQFYLEKNGPQRDQKIAENELREQVGYMVQHTSFRGKLDAKTAPLAVLQTLGGPIHKEFQESASRNGLLVAEEYQDPQGRTCRRFHGDSKAGLAPFSEGGVRVRLSEISHFEGKSYLKGHEPKHVKAAMLLRSRGLD